MAHELRTLEQVLSLFDGGLFIDQLMLDHAKLIDAIALQVDSTQAAAGGSITIKLTYKQDRMGTLEMKAVKETVLPKDPPAKAIAWTTDDGMITPQNPNQMRMDLRDASKSAPIKSAG